MQASASLLAMFLLLLPVSANSTESSAPDHRYPVPVSPQASVQQKEEMRSNLVALRLTLTKLADEDYGGVETELRGLAHSGPMAQRAGASVESFRVLEKQFQAQVDKTISAARTREMGVVLRELGETMAFCQACHSAFRQQVGGGEGAAAHVDAK